MDFSYKYFFFKFRKMCLIVVLLGAFNYGLQFLGINLIDGLSNHFSVKNYNPKNVIYLLITLSAFYLLCSDKYFFTPFLGDTIVPCSLLNKEPPKNYNLEKIIDTEPNRKIIYWATLPDKKDLYAWDAYGDYSNSGVTFSDKNGKAVLKVIKPSSYKIPSGNTLSEHIHYRVCSDKDDPEGMLGRIETIFL